jgi:SAM-dependent methyltransferase
MASTHRTFDVAVWSTAADLALRQQLTRRLVGAGWRVRVLSGEQASLAADARVSLALVGGGTPAGWAADTLTARATEHGLLQRLSAAARAAETVVDVRSPLGAAHLYRTTTVSYDAIAEQFADQWFDHPPERELQHFLRQLRPRSRVLDAGCGPGHHAALIARSGHDVVGVDLSAGMLRQCRLRAGRVRTARMNLEALQFGNGAFDAVWCAAAILHVPRERLPRVLNGFRRVLRPGGLLGLNFQVGRRSELVERGPDRRFFEYYAGPGDVAWQLEAAGFTVQSALFGQTRRNTHALDLTLKWSTLYALAGDGLDARVGKQDRQAEVELGFGPGKKVDLVDA